MTILPTQISLQGGFVIPHDDEAPNSVVVEGRLVALRDVAPGEPFSVNMNFFVYDMSGVLGVHAGAVQGFKTLPDDVKQRMLYLCEPPVRAQAMRDGFVVRSTNDALVVRPNGEMGQTAYATRNIPSGTTLFHAKGLLVSFPTMYTICVGSGKHLLFGDAAECLAHSCDPNVAVKVNGVAAHDGHSSFDMVTIRDVAEGDLLTFCYLTTEWDMNSPFPCLCGAANCFHMIRGFKHLSDSDRQLIWHITSDYIRSLC
jgi:hypothetical protein